MLIELMPLAMKTATVLADSDSEGGIFYLLALGPAAAVFFYMTVYLRYRNTDKRHEYEHETHTEVADVKGYDRKVDHLRGLRHSRMRGANMNQPLERLGSGTTIEREY